MIAPLWKRWLADELDALAFALPFLPLLLRARGREPSLPAVLDVLAPVLRAAYQVSATTLAGQTLGHQALGIRVVDQRTGGTPTFKQAALRRVIQAVPDGLSLLVRHLTSLQADDALAAVRELQPEVKQLTEQYGTDRPRLNEALMALYEERNVNPAEGCRLSLVGLLPRLVSRAFLNGPALRGPLHQGIPDRLCGTVIIEAHDRRPPDSPGKAPCSR